MSKLRIAQFGTFDVDNYGDLLFPFVARWRCPEFDWISVSPLGLPTCFADALPAISFEAAEKMDFDAIVIGGGNIISTRATSLLAYAPAARTAYPSLWIGAAAIAAERGIPLIFNAPGILHSFATREENDIASAVFSSASYIAVRDVGSARIVAETAPSSRRAFVVPDTVFDLRAMWPFDDAERMDRARYFSIHVNERYCEPIDRMAAALDSLARELDAEARFVPIGPCHGDRELAVAIADAMERPASVMDPVSLRSMEREIAGSTCYIGSSMHGFITALCAAIPAALVLGPKAPMRKFEGMLSEARMGDGRILPRWSDVVAGVFEGEVIAPRAMEAIRERLDEHWDRVRAAIASGSGCKLPKWARDWRSVVRTIQIRNRVARSGLFLVKKIIG